MYSSHHPAIAIKASGKSGRSVKIANMTTARPIPLPITIACNRRPRMSRITPSYSSAGICAVSHRRPHEGQIAASP